MPARAYETYRRSIGRAALLIAVGVQLGVAIDLAHAGTRFVPAIAGLQNPVDIASARDGRGRLFIVEQPGRIRVAKNGQKQRRLVWEIGVIRAGDRCVRSPPVREGNMALTYVRASDKWSL